MLPREDFIFTIGYDGPTAVVDKQAKRKFGKLSTRELAEKGLFRSAYSSSVYSGDKDEQKFVADRYSDLTNTGLSGVAGSSAIAVPALDRLFGVFPVDVKRSISI